MENIFQPIFFQPETYIIIGTIIFWIILLSIIKVILKKYVSEQINFINSLSNVTTKQLNTDISNSQRYCLTNNLKFMLKFIKALLVIVAIVAIVAGFTLLCMRYVDNGKNSIIKKQQVTLDSIKNVFQKTDQQLKTDSLIIKIEKNNLDNQEIIQNQLIIIKNLDRRIRILEDYDY